MPEGQKSTGCDLRSEPDTSQGSAVQCQPGASANLAHSLNQTPGWERDGCRGKWLARSGAAVSNQAPCCCLCESNESCASWLQRPLLSPNPPPPNPAALYTAMKAEGWGTGIVHRAPAGVSEQGSITAATIVRARAHVCQEMI